MTTKAKAKGLKAAGVAVVASALGTGVTDGLLSPYEETLDFEVDHDGIERLLMAAQSRFPDAAKQQFECDGWLAPRLHYFMRISRRAASNLGFWRHLTVMKGLEYVEYRWGTDEKPLPFDRVMGGTGASSFALRRNALARLWWAAEMARNGSDYSPVLLALKNSGADQYGLDLRYGYLRPGVIAFERVLLGLAGGGEELSFEEAKEFSKRVNLYLSATSLEGLGDAVGGGDELDREWYGAEASAEDVVAADLKKLPGPADGAVTEAQIKPYEEWYGQIAKELVAARRDAKRKSP
jgi:hypothetical protein